MVKVAKQMNNGPDDIEPPGELPPVWATCGSGLEPETSAAKAGGADLLAIADRMESLAALFVEAQQHLTGLADALRAATPPAVATPPAFAQPAAQSQPPRPALAALVPPSVADPAPAFIHTVLPTSINALDQAAAQADPVSQMHDSLADAFETMVPPARVPVPVSVGPARPAAPELSFAPSQPTADLPMMAADSASDIAAKIDAMLPAYRALLARPRKADLNNWIEAQGGQTCEVRDDPSLSLAPWDGTGLLTLVQVNDEIAVIVPGSRMVVEFATGFSNLLSTRAVTRNAFDLSPDGVGALQMVSPAIAKWGKGQWYLAQPGRLAGFTN